MFHVEHFTHDMNPLKIAFFDIILTYKLHIAKVRFFEIALYIQD